MQNEIELTPIERGPAYQPGGVVDPSTLEGRPVPKREWFVEGLIPHKSVTLFTGDGGLGKSLLMQQLMTAAAVGLPWLGLDTRQCRTFGLFCEDSNEELWRRQRAICDACFLEMADVFDVRFLSGESMETMLMSFNSSNQGRLTRLYHELLDFLRIWMPEVVIVDTIADTFGGNELSRVQTRNFINAGLGRICVEIGATVILTGHPSRTGMKEGDGLSGSTAWNNSVRSRLYLTRPEEDHADPDERILKGMKSNYGPSGGQFRLRWSDGVFQVVDTLTLQSREAIQSGAEIAVIQAMHALGQRGVQVTLARNQGHYAPKVMKPLSETNGFNIAALEGAIERLFKKGVLVNAEDMTKPPSRRTKHVCFAEGDHVRALIEAAMRPENPFPERRTDHALLA